jgi:hypothetical protein
MPKSHFNQEERKIAKIIKNNKVKDSKSIIKIRQKRKEEYHQHLKRKKRKEYR